MRRKIALGLGLMAALAFGACAKERRFGAALPDGGTPFEASGANAAPGAAAGADDATGLGEPGLATGSGATLLTEPASIDFGPIPVAFAAPRRVQLVNTGSTELPPPVLMVGGPHAGDFAIAQSDCSVALAPGGRCSVSLTFQPSEPTPRSAQLEISAGDGADASLPLTGTGVEASSLIVEAAPGGSADFGDVLLAAESVQTFRIVNPTEGSLGLLELYVGGPAFSLLPAEPGEC